jgi:pyrimidine operon attenuation protein / uracil phosphoribosyltransferase
MNNNKIIQLMDAHAINKAIARIAHEVIERNADIADIAIVGIRTRGEYLAQRLIDTMQSLTGETLAHGVLDITLYRDDIMTNSTHPVVHETDLSFDVAAKHIVLVDDVLYTGRTIRAALNAVIDFGRPKSIQLAVLVDRGHRELPIRADYVGKNIPTARTQAVHVRLKESDNHDEVCIAEQDR